MDTICAMKSKRIKEKLKSERDRYKFWTVSLICDIICLNSVFLKQNLTKLWGFYKLRAALKRTQNLQRNDITEKK